MNSQKNGDELDLVCHSMGGLDSVAAIAVNKNQDTTATIQTPFLKGVNLLITVATPHRGSPTAGMADTKITQELFRWSESIRKQGSNMHARSRFMQLINRADIRNQLLSRVAYVYTYGGYDDIVVPPPRCKINTDGLANKNYTNNEPYHLARHSMRRGITQDSRMLLEILKLLQKS